MKDLLVSNRISVQSASGYDLFTKSASAKRYDLVVRFFYQI